MTTYQTESLGRPVLTDDELLQIKEMVRKRVELQEKRRGLNASLEKLDLEMLRLKKERLELQSKIAGIRAEAAQLNYDAIARKFSVSTSQISLFLNGKLQGPLRGKVTV